MGTIQPQLQRNRALSLLVGRVAMVAASTLVVWLIARMFDAGAEYPPSPLLASLALLPVNLMTLHWVRRLLRSEGGSLRAMFAPRSGRLLVTDIGWGLLWIVVLYLPFLGAIVGTMWLLHGAELFTAFETVFLNPDAASVTSPVWGLVLGGITLLTFAPLNAPAEEALYRGYAQSRLAHAWSTRATVVVCSVLFGLQHAFFAPSADAMLVYVTAFTVWGIGSALIVLRQRRLFPITVAHFLVNLTMTLPAVVFPALQLAGVVPS